jgi:hypothetical protein
MELTECSEMSAHQIQALANHPKEEYTSLFSAFLEQNKYAVRCFKKEKFLVTKFTRPELKFAAQGIHIRYKPHTQLHKFTDCTTEAE